MTLDRDDPLRRDLAPAPPPPGAQLDKQRIKAALFPRRASPARIGRYTVLGLLGRGGMGVVYACHDDRLGRKVAVKVLHTDLSGETARVRLQREAQALARLSHPNVVAIHDVDVLDEHVYLAMEFVDGLTLGAWLHAAPRSWREVLRVVLAAGEGLAAAHARGLVHRDIKPDNIMVGADGRVRVMDFGLARADATGRPDLSGVRRSPALSGVRRPDALADHLTRTDALLGTPAYMAPEQLLCEPTSPRTDQFCLCLTAWEALHGQRAFAGDDLDELAERTTAGALTPPPPGTRVPVWLRRVLERGLRPRPDDRFPDMRALLTALRADPTPRRRVLGLVAGLAVLALAGLGVHRGLAVSACDAAGAQIDADWNDAARTALARSFGATDAPHAPASAELTVTWLDRWAATWRAASVDTCRAHTIEHRRDADLHARATDCLGDARAHFTALVATLAHADADAVARAPRAAADLPHLGECQDPPTLRERVLLPDDRHDLLPLRDQLARAAALAATGSLLAARDLAAAAVTAARDTALPLLVARAELRAAALAEALADRREAEAGLLRSLVAAREARSPADIIAASSRLAFVVGHLAARHAEGKVWAAAAQNQLSQLTAEHPLAQAGLDADLARIHADAGELDDAHRLVARALATREQQLGADHPQVADLLVDLADLQRRRGARTDAIASLTRALEIYAPADPRRPAVADRLASLPE